MYTILGSSGFIGSHLLAHLKCRGDAVRAPDRHEIETLPEHLGDVIYCIGLTADFRDNPLAAVEAHVSLLGRLLCRHEFESITYFSATRFYQRAESSDEGAHPRLDVTEAGQLYDLSKLTGESMVLNTSQGRGQVVRLANVYGLDFHSNNFLSAVLREAAMTGATKFRTSPNSAKDYIAVEDVIGVLPAIVRDGCRAIYNLSSGFVTTNQDIAGMLQAEGIAVDFALDAPTVVYPAVDNTAVREDFDLEPTTLSQRLPTLLRSFQKQFAHAEHAVGGRW